MAAAGKRLSVSVVPLDALDESARSAIVRLCTAALGVDCTPLFGFLSDSTHVLAHVDGRLVGHACWTMRRLEPAGVRPLRTAWVDAVCVAPPHQQQGIGTRLMRRLADATEDHELSGLGTERMSFFERLGWERWHGPTAGVHYDPRDSLMILRRAATPDLDTTVTMTAR